MSNLPLNLPLNKVPHRVPRVSVIMRCKNAEETLAEVLKSLFSQRFKDFELIVADSGSRDRSLSWLQAWPHRLIQIPAQEYFPGRVLNQCCAAARGDILVFLNSDVVMLGPDTLAELLAPLLQARDSSGSPVKASFARQLPRPEADLWVRRDYALTFPASTPAPDWLPLSLPLAAMQRTAWEAMPFYTWAWGSEDSEWGQRARECGWQIVYTPMAQVMHSHNYTLRQLTGRRYIEGEADAWMKPTARYSILHVLLRTAADLFRDTAYILNVAKGGGWRDILMALPRRWIFHWAHYKGYQLGKKRLQSGSQDASQGQRMVLKRHPAA